MFEAQTRRDIFRKFNIAGKGAAGLILVSSCAPEKKAVPQSLEIFEKNEGWFSLIDMPDFTDPRTLKFYCNIEPYNFKRSNTFTYVPRDRRLDGVLGLRLDVEEIERDIIDIQCQLIWPQDGAGLLVRAPRLYLARLRGESIHYRNPDFSLDCRKGQVHGVSSRINDIRHLTKVYELK